MALTASKNITQLGHGAASSFRKVAVADGVKIYNGALVALESDGYCCPAGTGKSVAIGVADVEMWNDQSPNGQPVSLPDGWPNYVDNTAGANGARHVLVRTGVFLFKNKAGDLLTEAMIGGLAYVEDDETVRATAGSTVAAGILKGFNDAGLPLVEVKPRTA